MNKKHFFRITAFLLVVACVLVILCDLFEYPNSHMSERFKTFDDFEKGTVDAVYVGTSGVDRYWIAAKAFEDYGMTVYPLSVDALPPWNMLNIVKEALKKQNPKLLIIDTRPFMYNPEKNVSEDEINARRFADQLNFMSLNRLDAIRRSLKLLHELDTTISKYDLSYYLPFIRYHDMWSDEDFTFSQIGRDEAKYLGYSLTYVLTVHPYKNRALSDECGSLDKYNTEYLNELISYLKENNVKALFVSSPRRLNKEENPVHNEINRILNEAGMDCLNFLTNENLEKYKFDYSTDFYNRGHVNYNGAVRFTDYFAEYLSENYDLPDRRDDPKCESWHGVYDKIQKRVSELEKKEAKKNK